MWMPRYGACFRSASLRRGRAPPAQNRGSGGDLCCVSRRMPRGDYKTCRSCGRRASEVGALSHTRLCAECGMLILEQNALGMAYKTGVALLRWRRAVAASVGAVLLDDLPKHP